MSKRKLILLLMLVTSCSSRPVITERDVKDVVVQIAMASRTKFGSQSCLVEKFRPERLELPEALPDKTDWFGASGNRYRKLAVPKLSSFPKQARAKILVTQNDYGCSQTIRMEMPEFFEAKEKGRRYVAAVVYVDRLCGPICGEEYSVMLIKRSTGWSFDEDGFQPSGLMY